MLGTTYRKGAQYILICIRFVEDNPYVLTIGRLKFARPKP
jgi:hypothetical protein